MANIFLGLAKTSHSNATVIAAGPLVKQPATMPFRFVITRIHEGRYSVHREIFNKLDGDRASLSHGYYFAAGPEGFIKAQEKFAELIKKHAEEFATAYREEN